MRLARGPKASSLYILLPAVAAIVLSGCIRIEPDSTVASVAKRIPLFEPTFDVPQAAAKKKLEHPVRWCNRSRSERLSSFEALDRAVAPHWLPPPDTNSGALVAEFLHLSDAQIRDEGLYEAYEDQIRLEATDRWLTVAVRNSLVERYDSLTLAAFLTSYSAGTRAEGMSPARFAIHTGDLLDISTGTELLDALQVMQRVRAHYGTAIYSVGGNHDGATFGNISDNASDTRGLGVNRAEFVVAHLLFDPKQKRKEAKGDAPHGFGFASNEIVSAVEQLDEPGDRKKCGKSRAWDDCTSELIEDLEDRIDDGKGYLERPDSMVPLRLRQSAHVSGFADTYGQSIGYYEIGTASAPNSPRVRLLVLDTRKASFVDGELDPIQIGWLYGQLADALRKNEAAVLFAHHAPDAVFGAGGAALRRMLRAFPNVAAYFYGHSHWNEQDHFGRRVRLIQTGSLADFPQAGRDVRIYTKWTNEGAGLAKLTIWSQLWRPEGVPDDSDGEYLNELLDASFADARKEHNESLFPWRRSDLYQQFIEPEKSSIRVDGSAKQWLEGRRVERWAEPVQLHLRDRAPSAKRCLGPMYDEATERRAALGLQIPWAPRTEKPDAPAKKETKGLREASDIALLGGSAIVVSDDEQEAVWTADPVTRRTIERISLKRELERLKVDGAALRDLEGLTTWDADSVFAVCSLGAEDRGCLARIRLQGSAPVLSVETSGVRAALLSRIERWARDTYGDDVRRHLVLGLAERSAEAGGLNVEGLARVGDRLLFGLRGPTLREGGALVVPLENPIAVVERGAAPRFGEPWIVEARPGEGIRGMTVLDGEILVLLGPSRDPDRVPGRKPGSWFRIVRWSPGRPPTSVAVAGLENLSSPDGIAVHDGHFLIVDDLGKKRSPDVDQIARFRPKR